jgi:hypothetical protein
MARRTRPQAAPPPDSPEPAPVMLSISAQVGEETFTYYANYAEIASTAHDVGLLFARLPGKLPPEKVQEAVNTGGLTLTCDVQIVIPTTLIDGLIRALNTQKAEHERRYGTIHEPGASDAKSSGE